MSDLQIGLVALGVALIVVVLGVNWWQDRRARQHVDKHFAPLAAKDNGPDPLAENTSMNTTMRTTTRREPGLGAGRQTADAHEAHVDASEIDPACEVVIDVSFPEPVAGSALRPMLRDLHDVGGKPVRILAKATDDATHTHLHDDTAYTALQLVLLIANRSGPVTAIAWSQCWGHAEHIAEAFDAVIEGPEQGAVIEQARQLDQFCSALDVQVGLTLAFAQPQPAASILALAREAGFVLVDGRLLWLSDEGLTRFSLLAEDGEPFDEVHASVRQVTLLLDVPHSPAHEQAFTHMVEIARELAGALDAQVLDDQGRPVMEGSEAAIDEHLAGLYAQLAAAGMPAGSHRAKRVFS